MFGGAIASQFPSHNVVHIPAAKNIELSHK